MRLRPFGCADFGRLNSERLDRSLTPVEERLVEMHRASCAACSQVEEDAHEALQMLRLAALEPEPDTGFDTRVLRKVKVQLVRTKFNYWSPALFGAAIAGIAILAALQMIADVSRLPAIRVPGGQGPEMSRRDPSFPRLEAQPPAESPLQ